jgi:hypothetical protein
MLQLSWIPDRVRDDGEKKIPKSDVFASIFVLNPLPGADTPKHENSQRVMPRVKTDSVLQTESV